MFQKDNGIVWKCFFVTAPLFSTFFLLCETKWDETGEGETREHAKDSGDTSREGNAELPRDACPSSLTRALSFGLLFPIRRMQPEFLDKLLVLVSYLLVFLLFEAETTGNNLDPRTSQLTHWSESQ